MNNETELSKFLSYVLRHKPESIGITLDIEGWVDIGVLTKAAVRHNHPITLSEIQYVVKNSDKKRFSISEDGLSIRAVQGHSSKQVDISFQEKQPPKFLYHGTASRFLDAILVQGLKPMTRQYVHLSENFDTAKVVGERHGKVVVLKIDAQAMYQSGIKFFLSENSVWLVDAVSNTYLNPVTR